jgi:ClpP class serine protease
MNPEIMAMISSFLGSVGAGGQSRRGLSPWAIRAEEVISSLQMVRNLRGPAPQGVAAGMAATLSSQPLAAGSFARRVGNTAVVPVFGPLVARFSWSYWSYEEIVRDLRLAASTSGIDRIVMEIDSPGGIGTMIDTVQAAVTDIRKSMRVDAHIRGMGASAAYLIASAAESVTADRTSLIGSVGTLIHYVDMEGILTRLGGTVVEAIAEQSPNKGCRATATPAAPSCRRSSMTARRCLSRPWRKTATSAPNTCSKTMARAWCLPRRMRWRAA